MTERTWTYSDKPIYVPPVRRPIIWATYVKGRDPEFKAHTNLGHCKNALNGSKHGIVYRWMPPNGVDTPGDPEWTPVFICDSDAWKNGGSDALNEFLENRKGLTEPALSYTIQEQP